MESPLFVLTPYVYAKKQDGGFHSGRIEGKENENTYKIAFPDHTRSIVDEKDLVWLGFYRLPPHTWPKSPAIYPVKFPKDDDMFYNVDIKREGDYYSSRRPDSLRIIKNIKDLSCNGERKLSGEKYFSSEHCRCGNNVSDDNINFEAASTSEDRMRRRQARTSVLRLNRKALSAEISQKQNEHEMCSSTLDISTTENEWTRYNVGRERHFLSGSLQSTSPHPSPYNQHDPPYFNAPCLTPPSTPISLPPPLFVCNPYETAGFSEMNSGEWGQMDRRDVGGGKRKRRDNMKKCRKVYGIDNRDLWCTQCKWKKACSRFQIGNYVQRHF